MTGATCPRRAHRVNPQGLPDSGKHLGDCNVMTQCKQAAIVTLHMMNANAKIATVSLPSGASKLSRHVRLNANRCKNQQVPAWLIGGTGVRSTVEIISQLLEIDIEPKPLDANWSADAARHDATGDMCTVSSVNGKLGMLSLSHIVSADPVTMYCTKTW